MHYSKLNGVPEFFFGLSLGLAAGGILGLLDSSKFEQYQTFIAGILALSGAALTVYFIHRQTKHSSDISMRQIKLQNLISFRSELRISHKEKEKILSSLISVENRRAELARHINAMIIIDWMRLARQLRQFRFILNPKDRVFHMRESPRFKLFPLKGEYDWDKTVSALSEGDNQIETLLSGHTKIISWYNSDYEILLTSFPKTPFAIAQQVPPETMNLLKILSSRVNTILFSSHICTEVLLSAYPTSIERPWGRSPEGVLPFMRRVTNHVMKQRVISVENHRREASQRRQNRIHNIQLLRSDIDLLSSKIKQIDSMIEEICESQSLVS